MRILIVEDENELRGQLIKLFEEKNYLVDSAKDGEEGFYLAAEYSIDVAVIDLGLPKLDGITLIKRLRERGLSFPILILTARDRWEEKVNGLEAGGDDYLTKPFHMAELVARVNALVRRAGGWGSSSLVAGPLSIDIANQIVTLDGTELELTAFEYRILEYLMINHGKVISKDRLLERLYQADEERDSNVIEVFIRRLRVKLDPDNTLKPIETLRGRGYRFTIQVQEVKK